jgi:hypothetical protein
VCFLFIILGLKHESPQIFDKFMLTDFCKIDLEKSKENKVGLSNNYKVLILHICV